MDKEKIFHLLDNADNKTLKKVLDIDPSRDFEDTALAIRDSLDIGYEESEHHMFEDLTKNNRMYIVKTGIEK